MKHPTHPKQIFYDHSLEANMVTGPLLLALLCTFIYLPGMFQSAMAFSFVYISILRFYLWLRVPDG